MGGEVGLTEERIGVYRVLMGETEGKKPHARPAHRGEDNTTMGLQEVGWRMIGRKTSGGLL